MNTTLEIPDEIIERTMMATGTKSAQEAVLKALEEFVTQHDQRSLIPLLGTLEDFMKPDELEQMRSGK